MNRFVHLHAHSHYSLLSALPKIDELVGEVKKLGMDSWRTMVSSMMNDLRLRQRDAIVSFLTIPAPTLVYYASSSSASTVTNTVETVRMVRARVSLTARLSRS